MAARPRVRPAAPAAFRRYLAAVPKDRKPFFLRLQQLILELYPEADIGLSYQIPTYRAKSGWVALGWGQRGVTLYTNGASHIAAFKARHPGIQTGKACLNFKITDEFSLPALQQVVRHAIERPE